MPHQNNVAMSIPTPMQSTNITQKRNLMNAIMVSRRTNAKPIDDTESETGTVLIINGVYSALLYSTEQKHTYNLNKIY